VTDAPSALDVPSEALAAGCSLAARLLLLEVDPSLWAQLRRPALLASIETLAPGCRALLACEAASPEAIEALAVEYCTLFVLPGGVSLYAGAWAPGDAAEARAAVGERVRALHAALGVTPVGTGHLNVPADHLGLLLALAAVALERGEVPVAREIFALVTPWGEDVAARIEARATSPLYRATGGLVRETLAQAAALRA